MSTRRIGFTGINCLASVLDDCEHHVADATGQYVTSQRIRVECDAR